MMLDERLPLIVLELPLWVILELQELGLHTIKDVREKLDHIKNPKVLDEIKLISGLFT